MSRTPAVSVLVPTYERLNYLGAALASIREQRDVDFEVIVQDAGSSEPIPDFVRDLVVDDSRFRVFTTSRRLTPPETRSAALAHATAPVVSLLDADDLMSPGRLSDHLAALEAEPAVVAVAGRLLRVDRHGIALQTAVTGQASPAPMTPATIRWALPFASPALSSSLTVRVGALHQVGGFQIEYPRCDDYALLWRLSQIGDLRVLPTVAARYRVHADQVTTVDRGEQHREFIALRRRMHVSKLGHPVRSAPVIALTSKSPVSQRVFREVEELLDEHLRIALGDTGLSDSDSQWILDEHRRRLTRVRDRVSSGDPANSLKR